MHHINGAYITYFNVKRDRSGHLFKDRYKAILVDGDEYAVELSRYIQLNPLRAGIVPNPEEYKSPLTGLTESIFFGGDSFVSEIKSTYLGDKKKRS